MLAVEFTSHPLAVTLHSTFTQTLGAAFAIELPSHHFLARRSPSPHVAVGVQLSLCGETSFAGAQRVYEDSVFRSSADFSALSMPKSPNKVWAVKKGHRTGVFVRRRDVMDAVSHAGSSVWIC
jgi:hypothetical protein